MKYIKKLEIKDFMTHKHTVMEFVDGINIITGDTASGKTNIIRALIWLFYNTPSGDKFIRYGAKEAIVSIILNDGIQIIRGKDRNNTNYYYLVDAEGNKTEFNNFGHEFPTEVKKALGLSEIRISDKSAPVFLNLCAQLEQPFFVNDDTVSSSERAMWISTLMNIDEIDSLVDELTSNVNSIKRGDLKNKKDLLGNQKEEMETYDNLPQKEEQLEQSKTILSSLQEDQKRLESLNDAKEDMLIYKKKTKKFNDTMSKVKAVLQHEEDINNIENQYEKFSLFVDLEKDLSQLKEKFKTINKKEEELSVIQDCNTSSAEDLIDQLGELLSLEKQLESLKKRLLKNKKQSKQRQNEINESIQKYTNVLQEMGKCPVCLTDIGDDVMSHIEEELELEEVDL